MYCTSCLFLRHLLLFRFPSPCNFLPRYERIRLAEFLRLCPYMSRELSWKYRLTQRRSAVFSSMVRVSFDRCVSKSWLPSGAFKGSPNSSFRRITDGLSFLTLETDGIMRVWGLGLFLVIPPSRTPR